MQDVRMRESSQKARGLQIYPSAIRHYQFIAVNGLSACIVAKNHLPTKQRTNRSIELSRESDRYNEYKKDIEIS